MENKNLDKNIQLPIDSLKKSDENSIKNEIISSIKNNSYKCYIPKHLNYQKDENEKLGNIFNKKFFNPNEIDNEWYIIGITKDGPYNDFNMYNKLYQIYYESYSKNENVPNYIINEKKLDIFMTIDECFEKLKMKYENQNQKEIYPLNNQYLVPFPKFINPIIANNYFYQNQILRNYQLNKIKMFNNADYNTTNFNNINNISNNKNNSYQNKSININSEKSSNISNSNIGNAL